MIYYGDEIGMGDNIYLGDRNARADADAVGQRSQRRFLARQSAAPVPAGRSSTPSITIKRSTLRRSSKIRNSLLWWMRRLVALRQRTARSVEGPWRCSARTTGRSLAFIRRYKNERILCVFNLSRNVQCVGAGPLRVPRCDPDRALREHEFPPIGELPYFITLGPHGFYWFLLESEAPSPSPERSS